MSTGTVKRGIEVWMQEEKDSVLDFGGGHAQMSRTGVITEGSGLSQ